MRKIEINFRKVLILELCNELYKSRAAVHCSALNAQ